MSFTLEQAEKTVNANTTGLFIEGDLPVLEAVDILEKHTFELLGKLKEVKGQKKTTYLKEFLSRIK